MQLSINTYFDDTNESGLRVICKRIGEVYSICIFSPCRTECDNFDNLTKDKADEIIHNNIFNL